MSRSLLFLQKKFKKQNKTKPQNTHGRMQKSGSLEPTAKVLGRCSTEPPSLCPAGVSYITCAHSSASMLLMPVKAAFFKGIVTSALRIE